MRFHAGFCRLARLSRTTLRSAPVNCLNSPKDRKLHSYLHAIKVQYSKLLGNFSSAWRVILPALVVAGALAYKFVLAPQKH